ncbi:EamA family transporter [Pelosinus baikalensis]|uniref:EamA family transporter n=1 Tax=Pelosinus baikalensis TaxID=2892015 RepID=UPI001E2A3C21|nr:EamA family transporter [Pelosinus baikalensis]
MQIIGQSYTLPSHTATILSMQTVFAAFGGYLLLGELLGLQEILGCIFIIVGMFLATNTCACTEKVCEEFFIFIRGLTPVRLLASHH